VILSFVGIKMLLEDVYEIPIGFSLGAIAALLLATVAASLLFPEEAVEHSPVEHGPLESLPEPSLAPIEPDPDLLDLGAPRDVE
jgi:tellurite resistance protein TerC